MKSDIYDLVSELNNSLSELYQDDEFYHKAETIIQHHGYELKNEEIREVPPEYDNFDLEQEHVEIISEFHDEDTKYWLKFIVNYGSTEIMEEEIELVGGREDFTELPLE